MGYTSNIINDQFKTTIFLNEFCRGSYTSTNIETDNMLSTILGYNLKYKRAKAVINGSICALSTYDFARIGTLMYCAHIKKYSHNIDNATVKIEFNALNDFRNVLNSLPIFYFANQDTYDDIIISDYTENEDENHKIPIRGIINPSHSNKPNNKFTLLLGPSVLSTNHSLKIVDTGMLNNMIKLHDLKISETGIYTNKYGIFTDSLLIPSYFIYPEDYYGV